MEILPIRRTEEHQSEMRDCDNAARGVYDGNRRAPRWPYPPWRRAGLSGPPGPAQFLQSFSTAEEPRSARYQRSAGRY